MTAFGQSFACGVIRRATRSPAVMGGLLRQRHVVTWGVWVPGKVRPPLETSTTVDLWQESSLPEESRAGLVPDPDHGVG